MYTRPSELSVRALPYFSQRHDKDRFVIKSGLCTQVSLLRCLAFHFHDLVAQLLHFLIVRRPAKSHPTHHRLQMRMSNANRQSVPTHNAHPNTRYGMRFDIAYPTIHHLGICVEGLDRTRVHPPLKVLLRLFVYEWATRDGPQRTLRGEGDDAGDRDPKRRGGVGRKMRGELDGLRGVGAELDERDRDAVRARMSIRLEDAAPVDYA